MTDTDQILTTTIDAILKCSETLTIVNAALEKYAQLADSIIYYAPLVELTLDFWQKRATEAQAQVDAIELLLDREDAPQAATLEERLTLLLGSGIDRRRKPKVPCSRCGKRPAASKGLCRSCYNSAWESRKRKANEFSQTS